MAIRLGAPVTEPRGIAASTSAARCLRPGFPRSLAHRLERIGKSQEPPARKTTRTERPGRPESSVAHQVGNHRQLGAIFRAALENASRSGAAVPFIGSQRTRSPSMEKKHSGEAETNSSPSGKRTQAK